MTKATKTDHLVDITRLFEGDGPAPQDDTSISEGPGRRPMGHRHILFPDPLGILGKLTDGVVYDPLRTAIAEVIPQFPARRNK